MLYLETEFIFFFFFFFLCKLVKKLMLLLCIPEMLASNLRLDTNYPDVSMVFLRSST
jgi:hypothetical protein